MGRNDFSIAVLDPRGRELLRGIERADSVALDPHKWLYAPFEAGCVLARDFQSLYDAFHILPAYLVDVAGGPRNVNGLGQPMEWGTGSAGNYHPDPGPLGTLSNAAGRYLLLNVPVGQVTVRVELVGYRAAEQTVTVAEDASVVADIAVAQTAIALDQIVVTGAGQATEIRKLGNTISTISGKDLKQFSLLLPGGGR